MNTLDAINAAARRILEAHPPHRLAELPTRESTTFLKKLDQLIDTETKELAPEPVDYGWVDVHIHDGIESRWVGRWDDDATHAALECGYWWGVTVDDYGVGKRAAAEAEQRFSDRVASGDLLTLLEDWSE